MRIPFTIEQFFQVFARYNQAIWPVQLLAYVLGIVAVVLAIRGGGNRSRIVSGILGLFWVWMGIVYHIVHFSSINPAARFFGALFIVQGLILFLYGAIRGDLNFRYRNDLRSLTGIFMIAYSMILYPLLGLMAGHPLVASPHFGVAPCPATIFTFGILLWSSRRVPWFIYLIPFLWSLIGSMAALKLNVPQDYGLGAAGIIGTLLLLLRRPGKGYIPAESEDTA